VSTSPFQPSSVRLYILASTGEAYVRIGTEDLYMLADDFLTDGGCIDSAAALLEDDKDTLLFIKRYERRQWGTMADEIAAGISI